MRNHGVADCAACGDVGMVKGEDCYICCDVAPGSERGGVSQDDVTQRAARANSVQDVTSRVSSAAS